MTPKLHPSITPLCLLCALSLLCGSLHAADPGQSKPPIEESFTGPLSEEWFWQLGTWTAKDGVLRGFESGPRRHGPAKVRRVRFHDATVELEFRLERGARSIGIGERGTGFL